MINVPKPDVAKELAAFSVADGFEVNLFASDPMIANPIQMHWDNRGRLWVVGSAVYPHIEPGQVSRDSITVLEDTNGDGAADKSTIFADNLLIPTGIAVGDGGVYVANSTEILHLRDTDGDLRADDSRVVLSGFGTEDTHHIVHSFRWGYDGFLYFNQAIYIHSHVETPHGPRHLNAGGVWQYRTDTQELDVFTRGLVNSWGHHFDPWGQSFQSDGAGWAGINYAFPGAAFVTADAIPRVLPGLNPGSPKYSGLEIINGRHFPPEWIGDIITNDFRGHRVVRFEVSDDQSGFSTVQQSEVLTSRHVAFRPVDVRMGPDGALYISDWYNPIIQHGEVDFRDPRRDHEHGRIWRVTNKTRPLIDRPSIEEAPIDDLLTLLRAPEQWNRIHAKRALLEHDRTKVVEALNNTLVALDQNDADFENARLEILWSFQTIDVVNEPLLSSLLSSTDYRVRAASVRVLSEWKTRLADEKAYVDVLTIMMGDEHPRVRLETVCALARSNHPTVAAIAMRAMSPDMDPFLEYALWTTMRETKDIWLSAIEKQSFFEDDTKLLYALKAVNTPDVVPILLQAYTDGRFTLEQGNDVLDVLASHATAEQLGIATVYLLKEADLAPSDQAAQLRTMVDATERRGVIPEGNLKPIAKLIRSRSDDLKNAGVYAAGQWHLDEHAKRIRKLAKNENLDIEARKTAMTALSGMDETMAIETLADISDSNEGIPVQLLAMRALLPLAPEMAADRAVTMLSAFGDRDPSPLFRDFMKTEDQSSALATALQDETLPAEIAKIGLRTLTSSGRTNNDLSAALNRAGSLGDAPTEFSNEEMVRLVAAVQDRGDAARGQALYRSLDCAQCHSIAGSGGTLGPEMTSIGGSAQIDYLIESNYFPNKAIKEGFHSLLIEKENGELYSGIKVSESDTELLLRDATSKEVRIPIDTIIARDDGGSLMPTGLADSLLEDEFLDLVRFLSELGRTPAFSANTDRTVRTWRVLSSTDEARDFLYEEQPEAAVHPHEVLSWVQAYGNVDGAIPLNVLPKIQHRYWKTAYSFLKFAFDTTQEGQAAITVTPQNGARLWVNGEAVELSDVTLIDLPRGETECVLILDRSHTNDSVRVQLVEHPSANASTMFRAGR
jgi:putative heme-binding domain-containing protein